MRWRVPTGRNWFAGLLGAFLSTGAGLFLYLTPFGQGLIDWSYDLFFMVRPPLAPTEVAIVYMDDDSHAQLEQPFNAPWDRLLHARLVEKLAAEGARAVVFDVVFSDPHPNPAVDQRFSQAIQTNGHVVLAADTVPAGYGIDAVDMRLVTPPTETLREYAFGMGSAELMPSQDLVVRRHFHGSADDLLPSLSWAAAEAAGARVTGEEAARFEPRWVNYYGPPGTIPSVSYSRVLGNNSASEAIVRDRVVFVGARLFTVFAGQRKDEFRTPYSYWSARNQFMPGVEVQATLFLNLLRGEWLERSSPMAERAVLVVFGLMFGFVLAPFQPWRAALHAVLGALAVAGLAYVLCAHFGGWFPWLLVVVQIGLAFLCSVAFHYAQMYVKNRVLEESLSVHTSPQRVKQLLKSPELLKPGASKQELSILFSDIANFTGISEGMDSDKLATLMNRYFEAAITGCIHATDGYVVKYIGDAVFAIWNAPLEQPDHRERACEAALRFGRQGVEYATPDGKGILQTRIGLHTGVANVGNFGSVTRVDYTAFGESVNIASRMEGLNKHLGTRILVTGVTQAAVVERLLTRPLGRFQLKGLEKAIEVYELVGGLELTESTRAWRESFAQGLDYFRQTNFHAARESFCRTLELSANDGPSLFYIAEMVDMLPQFLPDGWAGEVIVREK